MLQSQTILQHFYKLLMWAIFNWISSKLTINMKFLFVVLKTKLKNTY